MPPRPFDDIDFPDLRGEVLEILYLIWTFIRDVCIAFWSMLSQAFWAAWTWPPFETFRNDLAAALIAFQAYAVDHPITTVAIVLLVYVVIPGVLNTLFTAIWDCLGYRRQDLLRDSYGVNYQSTGYGGNMQRGSTVSRLQPQGARRGTSPAWD